MDVQDFAACLNCRCLSARRQAARLNRIFDRELRPYGLTAHQFSLLTVLILAGPSTISSLADRLGIERTTLTRNLAVCERQGWVRSAASKDARERLAEVTEAGLQRAREALPGWRSANDVAD
jgi:DNA-binding MarR family transcriptional regulator